MILCRLFPCLRRRRFRVLLRDAREQRAAFRLYLKRQATYRWRSCFVVPNRSYDLTYDLYEERPGGALKFRGQFDYSGQAATAAHDLERARVT